MKKFYSILTLVLVVMLVGSCEMNLMPEKTEALNKRCPIDMNDLKFVESDNYKVTAVTFDKEKNQVTFEVAVSEKENEDDAVKMLMAMGANLRLYAFGKLNEFPEFKEFATEAIAANSKVKIHFKSDKDNQEAEMEVPLVELKIFAEGSFKEDLGTISLEALVEGMNSLLPQDLGDGVAFNGVSLDKKQLQLNMSFDERQATVAMFKSVLPQLKKELAKNLNDEGISLLVKKCIAANRGLTVSFHGKKSGDSVNVEYTVDELKAAKW